MIARMTQLYNAVGVLVYPFSQADALTIGDMAADRATEIVNVARHHAGMWAALEAMTTGGDYVPFVVGQASMVMAILGNHGITVQSVMEKRRPKPGTEGGNAA